MRGCFKSPPKKLFLLSIAILKYSSKEREVNKAGYLKVLQLFFVSGQLKYCKNQKKYRQSIFLLYAG